MRSRRKSNSDISAASLLALTLCQMLPLEGQLFTHRIEQFNLVSVDFYLTRRQAGLRDSSGRCVTRPVIWTTYSFRRASAC